MQTAGHQGPSCSAPTSGQAGYHMAAAVAAAAAAGTAAAAAAGTAAAFGTLAAGAEAVAGVRAQTRPSGGLLCRLHGT